MRCAPKGAAACGKGAAMDYKSVYVIVVAVCVLPLAKRHDGWMTPSSFRVRFWGGHGGRWSRFAHKVALQVPAETYKPSMWFRFHMWEWRCGLRAPWHDEIGRVWRSRGLAGGG